MKTLTLLVAPVLLAGCGAAAAPTVTVTASRTITEAAPAPAPEPAPANQSDGELIRTLLASKGFNYTGPSSDLDSVAQSICDALDTGVSAMTLMNMALDSGFTADEGAALIAAAIVVKCPWNENVV